jgi:hypothetical protein
MCYTNNIDRDKEVIMENLGRIKVTQPRTALGFMQDAKTKIYVGIGQHIDDDIEVSDRKSDLCNPVAYFEVIHPSIMGGAWDEVVEDFCHFAKNRLLEEGMAESNKWGVLFATEKLKEAVK